MILIINALSYNIYTFINQGRLRNLFKAIILRVLYATDFSEKSSESIISYFERLLNKYFIIRGENSMTLSLLSKLNSNQIKTFFVSEYIRWNI